MSSADIFGVVTVGLAVVTATAVVPLEAGLFVVITVLVVTAVGDTVVVRLF